MNVLRLCCTQWIVLRKKERKKSIILKNWQKHRRKYFLRQSSDRSDREKEKEKWCERYLIGKENVLVSLDSSLTSPVLFYNLCRRLNVNYYLIQQEFLSLCYFFAFTLRSACLFRGTTWNKELPHIHMMKKNEEIMNNKNNWGRRAENKKKNRFFAICFSPSFFFIKSDSKNRKSDLMEEKLVKTFQWPFELFVQWFSSTSVSTIFF